MLRAQSLALPELFAYKFKERVPQTNKKTNVCAGSSELCN